MNQHKCDPCFTCKTKTGNCACPKLFSCHFCDPNGEKYNLTPEEVKQWHIHERAASSASESDNNDIAPMVELEAMAELEVPLVAADLPQVQVDERHTIPVPSQDLLPNIPSALFTPPDLIWWSRQPFENQDNADILIDSEDETLPFVNEAIKDYTWIMWHSRLFSIEYSKVDWLNTLIMSANNGTLESYISMNMNQTNWLVEHERRMLSIWLSHRNNPILKYVLVQLFYAFLKNLKKDRYLELVWYGNEGLWKQNGINENGEWCTLKTFGFQKPSEYQLFFACILCCQRPRVFFGTQYTYFCEHCLLSRVGIYKCPREGCGSYRLIKFELPSSNSYKCNSCGSHPANWKLEAVFIQQSSSNLSHIS